MLHVVDVCLPETRWKAVPQSWADSCKTSVPKVALGPPDDTSPQVDRMQLTVTFTADNDIEAASIGSEIIRYND